jgi:hypothetical protein
MVLVSSLHSEAAGMRISPTAMRRFAPTIVCALLLTASALTQPALRFEVASIRPTPGDNPGSTIGLRVTGSQVHYGGLTLKDYIGEA